MPQPPCRDGSFRARINCVENISRFPSFWHETTERIRARHPAFPPGGARIRRTADRRLSMVAMVDRTCLAVVLAAGEGTRMRAARPKVLHEVAGRTLLAHVLGVLREAGGISAAVVIGPAAATVAAEAERAWPGAEIFVQADRRGTAHAVLAAKAAIARGVDDLLVVFGDTPLIRPQTLARMR